MCGITAIVDMRRQGRKADLERMRAALAHRGPDSGKTFMRYAVPFWVGLGSQRLSILDLSPAGTMPMANEDKSIWIVYNGEIYNHLDLRRSLEAGGHQYRSGTDTETVLHAYEEYGLDCFQRFNGMFACVIYDARTEQVVIARDRTGIKPLYYVEDDRGLAVASELKAILAAQLVPIEIDPEALDLYLALGYVPSPFALIRGVKKLPPGSYGVYAAGQLRIERYWHPEVPRRSDCPRPWTEIVTRTRSTITQAIESQMMSDVPIGVMLSGGLDSTIVAAIAQRTSSTPLRTFSIGFEQATSAVEPIYNADRDHARQVAHALGTIHHEIVARDTADLEEHLRRLVIQLDEPVWEPSFLSIYLVSQLAREQGVTVLLMGDGSDELFGGYPWHPALRRLDSLERVPGLTGPLALLRHAPLPATPAAKIADLSRKYRRPDIEKYEAQYGIFSAGVRARLFERDVAQDPLHGLLTPLLAEQHASRLADRFALTELIYWVGDHFNQRLDRMTMAASVEGRVPFLDNTVIGLALSLSMAEKHWGGSQKAPLRAAFADTVPDFVLNRPKRPFAAPAAAWMHGALRPAMQRMLSAESLSRLPGIDPTGAHATIAGFDAGAPVRQEQLWTLFHLMLWLDGLEAIGHEAEQPLAILSSAMDSVAVLDEGSP